MALEVTLPPEQNQLGTTPLDVYVRVGQMSMDAIQQTMVVSFLGYSDKAAYDAGKNILAKFEPVTILPAAQPVQRDPETDEILRQAIPSYAELYSVFQAEFDFMAALGYELGLRFNPNLADAKYADPLPDPAVLADIRNRLDQANMITAT